MEDAIRKIKDFGICPMCAGHLVLLSAHYTGYNLNDSGTVMERIVDKKEHVMACPDCGWKHRAKHTINGIRPFEFREVLEKPVEIDYRRRQIK